MPAVQKTTSYRPDIDGLRAIAVLSVVFFHLDISIFSGGYIGVDVFFVISGYLISNLLLSYTRKGNFSFSVFYEKRLRRLIPALYLVLLTTFLVCYFIFSPNDFIVFGRNLIATVLSGANVYSYFTLDYFAEPSHFNPLLHAWSLSVEEQFYLIFPAFIYIFFYKKYFKVLVVTLTIASFLVSIYLVENNSQGAFYLPQSRAWELLVGCLLSLLPYKRNIPNYLLEIGSLIGIIFIFAAIFHYDSSTPFPGVNALVPVIGTSLIIYTNARSKTTLGKVIAGRLFVFFGLISYSLYLWHWPAIVFLNYTSVDEPSNLIKIFVFFACVFISYLSYRFIETPFRKKAILPSCKGIWLFTILMGLGFVLIGTVLHGSNGFPNRFNNVDNLEKSSLNTRWLQWRDCKPIFQGTDSFENCYLGNVESHSSPSFVIWGDSHARSFGTSFDQLAKDIDSKGLLFNHAACPPLLGIDREGRSICEEFNESVIKYLEQNKSIKHIVLSARWALSSTGERYKREKGESFALIDTINPSTQSRNNSELFELGLERTLDKLTALGFNIIIIGPVPEIGIDVPHQIHISNLFGYSDPSSISPTKSEFDQRNDVVLRLLKQHSAQKNVSVVNIEEYLCSTGKCHVIQNHKILYKDDNHISFNGAIYLKEYIRDKYLDIDTSWSRAN